MGGRAIRWNPYPYVGGNPVNITDPSGEFFPPLLVAAAIGAAVGAVAGGGFDLAMQMADNVANGRDAFACVDLGQALEAAAEGALLGAVSGVIGFGVGALGGRTAFSAFAGGAADFSFGVGWDMMVHGDSFGDAFTANLIGVGVGGVIGGVGQAVMDVDGASGTVTSLDVIVDADAILPGVFETPVVSGLSCRLPTI